jgi:hypothetical protein
MGLASLALNQQLPHQPQSTHGRAWSATCDKEGSHDFNGSGSCKNRVLR